MSLSSEELRDVGECFTQAFNHTMANTFGESKITATEFAYDIILRQHPWMMMTEQGQAAIISSVFGDQDVRDFVLTLAFNFFSYWGGERTQHEALAKTMAAASGFQTPTLIPKVINERMSTEESAESILINNRWLVCLLLMKVWIQAPDPESQPEKGKK